MATLLPNGRQQFIDHNGAPLVSGSVYMFQPNTSRSTLKDTWQNSEQTVLNTNPIVLDALGSAVIYGSGLYEQVVNDSDGNQIWDALTSATDTGGVGWGGTSTGTANAQEIAVSSFTQQDGQQISFIVGAALTNSGPATVSPGPGNPISVLFDASTGPQPLSGGEMVAGNEITLVYDAIRGSFHLVNPASGSLSGIVISNSTINTSTILLKQDIDPAPTDSGDIEWSTLFKNIKIGDGAGTQRFFPGPPPGLLYGCSIANNVSDATNDIDFASGVAVDSTNAFYMAASALTKRLDATWVVGTNQGGLFTGSIANTTYHCFVIMRPDTGVIDAGFDTSVTAANRPAAYTYYRRVGSIVRTGAAIAAFKQIGNRFTLITISASSSAPTTNSAVTNTLPIPTGIVMRAMLYLGINYTAQPPNAWLLATALFQTDSTPSVTNYTVGIGGAAAVVDQATNGTYIEIPTNTSAQIRTRCSSANAGVNVLVSTIGWVDSLT